MLVKSDRIYHTNAQQDIDLIEKRLKLAEQYHKEQYVDRSN
jgi:hypothetical protein